MRLQKILEHCFTLCYLAKLFFTKFFKFLTNSTLISTVHNNFNQCSTQTGVWRHFSYLVVFFINSFQWIYEFRKAASEELFSRQVTSFCRTIFHSFSHPLCIRNTTNVQKICKSQEYINTMYMQTSESIRAFLCLWWAAHVKGFKIQQDIPLCRRTRFALEHSEFEFCTYTTLHVVYMS